jgi:hypothetical protein
VSGIHTVCRLFWVVIVLYVAVVVSWGIWGLVSVSRMHTVFRRCAAAVIDCVIRRCGAVIRSACELGRVLSVCWCGGAVAAVSCRSGGRCCCFRSCSKSRSAASRISAVAERYELICSWMVDNEDSSSLWWASGVDAEMSGGKI